MKYPSTIENLIECFSKLPGIGSKTAERLALSTLNIDFDGAAADLDLSLGDAEKYIVSLKLQRYLDKLNIQKKELTAQLLAGDESVRDELNQINEDLAKAREKMEKLISL